MTGHTEFARMEQAGWADAATVAAYARDFGKAAEQCVSTLVGATRAGPGQDALDLCCGHGILANGLVAAGARVTGLDFSPAFLEIARQGVPAANFVEGDAMALPFDDESFDAIAIGCGIPHVPDPPRVLSECARVLRPGGRLAYSVWHGADQFGAFSAVFSAIARHGDPSVTMPSGPGAHDYGEPKRAFETLAQVGFDEMALETVESYWTCDDLGAVYDYFLEGTVRGGVMLRRQPHAAQAAIRAAVVAELRANLGETGPWRVPVPAAIISATRIKP